MHPAVADEHGGRVLDDAVDSLEAEGEATRPSPLSDQDGDGADDSAGERVVVADHRVLQQRC